MTGGHWMLLTWAGLIALAGGAYIVGRLMAERRTKAGPVPDEEPPRSAR